MAKLKNNSAFSLRITVSYSSLTGNFPAVVAAAAATGAEITRMETLPARDGRARQEFTINCSGWEHEKQTAEALGQVEGVTLESVEDRVFACHAGGKTALAARSTLTDAADLAIAYTPGVARPCLAIHDDVRQAVNLTSKGRTVAVVSDGTAVLGLGDIGPEAAMPVMEGKCLLFKHFANVDAVPVCIRTKEVEEIVSLVQKLEPTFGGINLEDISAPRCFEIEEKLKQTMNIPVFHDDQHGTAVVVLSGVINGLKVTGKKKENCRIVVNGAGSAGTAITKMLLNFGFPQITMCDKSGIIGRDAPGLTWAQREMAEVTNLEGKRGTLADAMRGADILVGVSAPNIVSEEMAQSMAKDAMIFAMANPVPEIMPEIAKKHVKIMATGRSDYPNQINNVLAFPGIFRGALDARARAITENMKLAAAHAIAGAVSPEELSPDHIIPSPFKNDIALRVAEAVRQAAVADGVADREPLPPLTFADLRH